MNKEQVIQKLKDQLDEVSSKIDQYERKAEIKEAEGKAEFQTKLTQLQSKKQEIAKKIDEAEHASDEKLEQIKGNVDEALKKFKAGFEDLKNSFK